MCVRVQGYPKIGYLGVQPDVLHPPHRLRVIGPAVRLVSTHSLLSNPLQRLFDSGPEGGVAVLVLCDGALAFPVNLEFMYQLCPSDELRSKTYRASSCCLAVPLLDNVVALAHCDGALLSRTPIHATDSAQLRPDMPKNKVMT